MGSETNAVRYALLLVREIDFVNNRMYDSAGNSNFVILLRMRNVALHLNMLLELELDLLVRKIGLMIITAEV